MIIAAHVPREPLSAFIETLWYHEGVFADYPMERLLPDGAIELIIDLTDTPKWTYCPASRRPARSYRRAWISGQHSRPILIESAKHSRMIGARFRPGGAEPFLGTPVKEINDSVVELESIWGFDVRSLRDELLDAPTVPVRFQVLERRLRQRMTRMLPDITVQFAVDRLITAPDAVHIRGLADRIGISHRHLIRKFDRHVGLSPKSFARIMRFQSALRRLASDRAGSGVDIAIESGYFDQAHFDHDFRDLAGMTPTQFVRDRGPYPNFIPVR